MHIEMTSQAKGDQKILTFDIRDAVLERAWEAEPKAFKYVLLYSPVV